MAWAYNEKGRKISSQNIIINVKGIPESPWIVFLNEDINECGVNANVTRDRKLFCDVTVRIMMIYLPPKTKIYHLNKLVNDNTVTKYFLLKS